MARGGVRKGAGGVSTWNSGKTKTIRVPEALSDELLRIARAMDSGEKFISQSKEKPSPQVKALFEPVTTSKVIDLSGVRVTHLGGEIAVRLEDLVKLGYVLQPVSLARMVEARMQRKYGL
jgi:hypothetical protein